MRLNDVPSLITVYRNLLLSRWYAFDEYYHKLKELVPPAEWPEQYSLIVEQGKQQNEPDFMARIYAEEKDYPELNEALLSTDYQFLEMLTEYMTLLPEEYHANLLQRGKEEIAEQAGRANKRSEYAAVVQLIRDFSALPGSAPYTTSLVQQLRETYHRRPAFMRELSQL